LAAEAGLSARVFANPDNVVPFVALRPVVRSLVAGGKFTVDDLAAAFGLSRRTLARRLN
jgi:AraC-like DNA-binding protein